MGQRMVIVEHALDQRLDRTAAGLAAVQPCLDDAGIVHHQQVAGGEQPDEVGKAQVAQAVALNVQQPAVAALFGRKLRDQALGKVVIEFGKQHGERHGRKAIAGL